MRWRRWRCRFLTGGIVMQEIHTLPPLTIGCQSVGDVRVFMASFISSRLQSSQFVLCMCMLVVRSFYLLLSYLLCVFGRALCISTLSGLLKLCCNSSPLKKHAIYARLNFFATYNYLWNQDFQVLATIAIDHVAVVSELRACSKYVFNKFKRYQYETYNIIY